MSSDPLYSSRSFVQALKAPSDPPYPESLPKIEIAREAWDKTSFYVPNKGEVIAEWVLSKLLKERTSLSCVFTILKYSFALIIGRNPNPLLDTRFWSLLADIVSPRGPVPRSRPIKIWLVPLLNRTSVVPIVVCFLNLLSSSDTRYRSLTTLVYRCLEVIWPIAALKVNFDTLTDCFRSTLGVCNLCKVDESLARLCLLITKSIQASLPNVSNKKKAGV
jgi:hypothetical protein